MISYSRGTQSALFSVSIASRRLSQPFENKQATFPHRKGGLSMRLEIEAG